ncbi:hypothetical protein ACHAWO_008125 [Cyclotella atomus]|uniref:Uncharacterized protein n=1 Tax=Cyclotella atomus TaxID=382360 RepID=A0ABD3PGH6_9STRA
MGDSLTRYQYLDMAYFLSHNGTCISNNDRPNMVIEKTHADWNTFYNFTNSILEPFETCDCFRIEGRLNTATVTENRYFLDTERNNTVTYLQKFDIVAPIEIHNKHELITCENNVSFINHWSWAETVQNLVCNMIPKPSAFVWNSGLWEDSELAQIDAQLQMTSSLRDCGNVSVYKTTTITKDGRHIPDKNRERMCSVADLCLNVSWTGMVPSDLYWDNMHFVPPIYSMLNLQLLSLLAFYEEVNFFE